MSEGYTLIIRKTYRTGGMGQVVPTVFGFLRPRLIGLEEHLPNAFVRNAEEMLQGLVLGRIELPQITGTTLAWKDPVN